MSKSLHKKLQAKVDALKGTYRVNLHLVRRELHLAMRSRSHLVSRSSGPEWDSSDEESPAPTKATIKGGKKKAKKEKVHGKKKGSKPVDPIDEEDSGDRTVLYIGHLPNEFEERDLKNFLQQFGKLVNLRISRSVKSGNSRGYAFCRFTDAETSSVVAETLNGYFIGSRRLVCQVVPNPHQGMFYDTDKIIARREIRKKAAEQQRQKDLSNVSKLKEITSRLVSRERKKRAKLEALGIDYNFPGYAAQHDEEGSHEEEPMEAEEDEAESLGGLVEIAEETESSKTKKKRKDSIDSVGSSSSRKRKDSIGSEGSSKSSKKGKRKDSMDSLESNQTPEKSKTSGRQVQSEKKKAKKNKKRRQSAP